MTNVKPNRVPIIIAALRALDEVLASQGEHAAVIVVGGTALIVQGFVTRATRDVDVIAIPFALILDQVLEHAKSNE